MFCKKYLCKMDFPIHSPLQQIKLSLLKDKNIELWVKRDDLIHAEISGNKFRKLKYNLIQAEKEGCKKILTFGGAYSNHIAATACAGNLFGFETIGIIRGEEPKQWNETLKRANEHGMKLKFVSREDYSRKNTTAFLDALKKEFGSFFAIPEGGANSLGVKGCAEIMNEVNKNFNYVAVACGTGTSLAGILSSLDRDIKAIGFPVLKGGEFIKNDLEKLLGEKFESGKLILQTNYHFGGYAKITEDMVHFANEFYASTGIPLDLVYTAKMFFGLMEMIKNDHFPQDSRIMAVHTGGLQGNKGMQERYKLSLDFC